MTMRHAAVRRLLVSVLLSGLAVATAGAQVGSDRLARAPEEPGNWLTYSGNYFSDRHSRLDRITPANVGDLERQWVYQSSAFGPSWEATPLVVDGIMYVTQRPNDVVRAGRADGARVLDLPLSDPVGPPRLLRVEQPWRGRAGRPALHGDARRARRGHRRGDRDGAVGRRGGGQVAGVRVHAGAAGGQGQGHRRHRRRRSRHPRLRRRARRGHRRGGLALLHHSGAGRTGARDVGAVPAGSGDLLRPRGVEARRGLGLADRFVRPGAEPDVLGRGQPGARLEPGAAARRQPVHQLGGGPRRRHGRVALALPVHARRSVRLRRRSDSRAGRHRAQRHPVPGDAVGETGTASTTCWTGRPAAS